MDQGADQAQFLLHAAGELFHGAIPELIQPRHGQEFALAFGKQPGRHLTQLGEEIDVLLHREFRIEIEPQPLGHESDSPFDLLRRRFGIYPDAKHLHLPALEREDAGDGLHQGALAGAVRADQAIDLTGLNAQIHAVHCHLLAIALAESPNFDDRVNRHFCYQRGFAHGASSCQRMTASVGSPGVKRCSGFASR